jgi:hypothetical protein
MMLYNSYWFPSRHGGILEIAEVRKLQFVGPFWHSYAVGRRHEETNDQRHICTDIGLNFFPYISECGIPMFALPY